MNFIAALAQLIANSFHFWKGSLEDPELPAFNRNFPPPSFHRPFINYQVDVPPFDYGEAVFTQKLLKREFAASWGEPCSVAYFPPPTDIEFSHVQLFLEVISFGVQYDRLAHIYFNEIEIWRPSTSEPRGKPTYSNYTKDVSTYLRLFENPGELSFELNNLMTERLNGTFSIKLTANYFNLEAEKLSPNEWFEHEGMPPTRIHKISDLKIMTEPLTKPIKGLPRNTTRAVLEVFASGNGNDEFWYAEGTNKSFSGEVTGPLRHILVEVDGCLAGAISPFYQVYTGGYQPALWSPFVAPNAYDVPKYHIDLTPFLPSLWSDEDGHEVECKILVLDGNDRAVSHEWIVSAALMTWECEGLEGNGQKYPTIESNVTSRVYLPNAEITDFTQNINVTSELIFMGKFQKTSRVEWIQERKVSGVITGGTVINHNSKGKSMTSYASKQYIRAHEYDIALVLGEYDIVVAQGYGVQDVSVEPTSPEDILSRTHNINYNGSWYLPDYPSTADRYHGGLERINGSDVLVTFRDPGRLGPSTYRRHAVSRNGSVLTLDQDDLTSEPKVFDYMARSSERSKILGGSPFVALNDTERKTREEIRRKWLRHIL